MAKPQIHFIPTNHWMNDPNGFIYFNGNYHLFYQYFPYENAWGTMHWGHKISKDLIHWQDLGIALYPSKPFDQNGVFSGSALEIEGKMYLYYTGVVYDEIIGDDIHRQAKDGFHACQALIISEDGLTFDNKQKEIVVPCFENNTQFGHRIHTRDPKVWQDKDRYFMILGCKYIKEGATDTTGEVLIYESDNAKDFHLISTLEDDSIGNMWECPDYFVVDNQGILTISPEHYYPNDHTHYTNVAVYMPVNFDGKNMQISGQCQLLDLGEDIYATQTNLDKDGNRTLIGWMRMPLPEKDGNWIGMMALPRVLNYKNQQLYTLPHPNISKAFRQPCGDFHASKARKMVVDLMPNGSIDIGGYQINFDADGYLHTDRSACFPADLGIATRFTTPKLDKCHLEIYSDLHIIEIFINDGQYVLSNIVYDLKDDIKFENVASFEIYKMSEENND